MKFIKIITRNMPVLAGVFFSLLFFSCSENKSRNNEVTSKTELATDENLMIDSEKKVDVYYFHSRMRCTLCVNLENVTKQTIEGLFSEGIADGKLGFHILNVDQPENRALAEKYYAFGPTLLVCEKNGRSETIIDLTAEGFRYASRDASRFASILKNTIEKAL